MGKVLITADIHNGVPGKLGDTIWSMNIMRQYASKHGIRDVLILGDLFHDRTNLNIEVLFKAYSVLKNAKEQDQDWLCFPGNHDMFLKNSWDINSLKPLENVIEIIETRAIKTIHGQKFHILPFIHYEDEYMENLNLIEKKHQEGDILLTHIGVCGAKLNECFLLKNWSVVDFKDSKFDKVYTGHFHCHQQVGENVWYPGSPIPFRFDEGLVDHGFFVFDTEKREHEFVKIFDIYDEFDDYCPPDFITVVDKDLMSVLPDLKDNHVKIVLSKDYTSQEITKIKTILKSKGVKDIKLDLVHKKIDEAKHVSDIKQIGTPRENFEAWLKHDNPKQLEHDLLLKIHDKIELKAEEKVVTTMEDDE